mgnify:CR=1 FL=1
MHTSPQRLQTPSEGPPPVIRNNPLSPSQGSARHKKKPRILACVSRTLDADAVAAQSIAVAHSLGLEVTFASVIAQAVHSAVPADPIEWQLNWEQQNAHLRDLEHRNEGSAQTSSVVLVGDPSEELIDWGAANGASLLALTTGGLSNGGGMGSTALRILQSGATSLLLVPPQAEASVQRYHRILVPVDGSARAESVLPIAKRIARTHGAELILVHVVPETTRPEGFVARTPDKLQTEFEREKQQTAKLHLEQLRARTEEESIRLRSLLLGPADPRTATCQFASDLSVDLVIMSSHGATALSDVPCGSVAEYLATHCSMPVLMVRPNLVTDFDAGLFDTNGQSVFRFG